MCRAGIIQLPSTKELFPNVAQGLLNKASAGQLVDRSNGSQWQQGRPLEKLEATSG